MNTELHHHTPLVFIVFVLIVASALTFSWYVGKMTAANNSDGAIRPTSTIQSAPATSVQATTEENPLEGVYTNPF